MAGQKPKTPEPVELPGKTYLFVYGTLRRQAQHPMPKVLAGGALFVGKGKFCGRLYHLGGYPGAVPSLDKKDSVVGEVYRLRGGKNAFVDLDDYEGKHFRRERAAIVLENGEEIISWIYLYLGSTAGHQLIPTGDYMDFLKGN